MTQKIDRPYVVIFSKTLKAWVVTYRFMLNGKIQFRVICECNTLHAEENARQIAQMFNDKEE